MDNLRVLGPGGGLPAWTRLSGLEDFCQDPAVIRFTNVGERCNIAGSITNCGIPSTTCNQNVFIDRLAEAIYKDPLVTHTLGVSAVALYQSLR